VTSTIDPLIVVPMHDGFYGCGTGAGRSNRAFLRILTGQMADGLRLAVLPVWLQSCACRKLCHGR
jgi:hypothetical protein